MSVLIIAEAGVNHNGNLELAKRLIDVASEAGADYVKFQTFKADLLVAKNAKKAEYQKINLPEGDDSQFNMLKSLELSEDDHLQLIDHSKRSGIKFLSTGFDIQSIDFLDSLGIDLFKIPSGELTNKPYLKHVASKRRRIVLSTGMATMDEVEGAIRVIESEGVSRAMISVLHCTTEYPTPMEDVNLKAMLYMKEHLGVDIGYSDHTLGIEVPIAATALGAGVIEKHFTLDKNMKGPDHRASLEPRELIHMVSAIRNIEKALSGSGFKEPSKSEMKNRDIARKSIHVGRDLPEGHILSYEDLIMLRPGHGISPMEIENVIEKKLVRGKKAFDILSPEDFDVQ